MSVCFQKAGVCKSLFIRRAWCFDRCQSNNSVAIRDTSIHCRWNAHQARIRCVASVRRNMFDIVCHVFHKRVATCIALSSVSHALSSSTILHPFSIKAGHFFSNKSLIVFASDGSWGQAVFHHEKIISCIPGYFFTYCIAASTRGLLAHHKTTNVDGIRSGNKFSIEIIKNNQNILLITLILSNMAGIVGFEPTDAGFRVRSLTTWRYPKVVHRHRHSA